MVVEDYLAAMRAADRRTGRSTTRAARSCQAKIRRAGGWGRLNRAEQLDAVVKAPSFASWLMVTGRITVDAELLSATDLRLGNAARLYCADDHRWFREICSRLEISGADTTVQWNTLAKITAITGAATPRGHRRTVRRRPHRDDRPPTPAAASPAPAGPWPRSSTGCD